MSLTMTPSARRTDRCAALGVVGPVGGGDRRADVAAMSWATTRAISQRRVEPGRRRPGRTIAGDHGRRWTGLNGRRKKSTSTATIVSTANRTTTDEAPPPRAPRGGGARRQQHDRRPARWRWPGSSPTSARRAPPPGELELVLEEVEACGRRRQPRRDEAQPAHDDERARGPGGVAPGRDGPTSSRCARPRARPPPAAPSTRGSRCRGRRAPRPGPGGRPAPPGARPARAPGPGEVAERRDASQNHGLAASTSVAQHGPAGALVARAAGARTRSPAGRSRRRRGSRGTARRCGRAARWPPRGAPRPGRGTCGSRRRARSAPARSTLATSTSVP